MIKMSDDNISHLYRCDQKSAKERLKRRVLVCDSFWKLHEMRLFSRHHFLHSYQIHFSVTVTGKSGYTYFPFNTKS